MLNMKSEFKEGEPTKVEKVLIDHGDKFAIIASSHGDFIAYREAIDKFVELGAEYFFHSGDITGEFIQPAECIEYAFTRPNSYGVLGNHDLLVLGYDYIYTYNDTIKKTAEETAKLLDSTKLQMLNSAPIKIETPFFNVVHESVSPPYYAQRSKKRRKSRDWSIGSCADENTTSVCYGRIDKVHFIGSDHAAYVLHAQPRLKVIKPRPGDELIAPSRSVVSAPSITFSRDLDYDCGGILGEILEDGSVKLKFISFKPLSHSELFSFCFKHSEED